MDCGVTVVAVGFVKNVARRLDEGFLENVRVSEFVGVGVHIVGRTVCALVDFTVAVVVLAVADFRRSGIDCGVAVVAVGFVWNVARRLDEGGLGNVRVAESVGVGVQIVGRTVCALVDFTVAVVVLAVADFRRSRINRSVAVVAVGIVKNVARRLDEGFLGNVRVSESVGVGVQIVGRTVCILVDFVVAVVVLAVADFRRSRIDCGVDVVAVGIVKNVARRLDEGFLGNVRVSESVGVGVQIVGRTVCTLVDLAVAVVVLAVADLRSARIDVCIAVVAVSIVGNIPLRGTRCHYHVVGVPVSIGIRISIEW